MSPLLEQSIDGARGVLFTITGGADLTLFEVNEAAEIIHAAADPEANIIFGAVVDERMGNEVKISVIATGFDPARPLKRIEPYRRSVETPRPVQQPQPVAAKAVPAQQEVPIRRVDAPAPAPAPQQERDDLEIPAFLRRRV
jgi:cell division protein FtsZ